jgi:hypothetical protein
MRGRQLRFQLHEPGQGTTAPTHRSLKRLYVTGQAESQVSADIEM